MTRLALILLVLLASCGVIGKAAAPLDAYTLRPLPMSAGAPSGRHLVVELPTASGALATDRILIKPNPLQAQYLPKGRWVDPAPQLMQTLLVGSLQNANAFRLVGRDGAGLVPDYVLLVEMTAFQAEVQPPGPSGPLVRVALTLTLLREADRTLLATRRFEQTSFAANAQTQNVVVAFDVATQLVLAEAVAWTRSTAR